jgi:hypothetical protein
MCSTDAKLVGASDYLSHSKCVKIFLEAQRPKFPDCILEQDNYCAIKLEKKGRASAGPKSRQIKFFFCVQDITQDNGIKMEHCPMLQMFAGFCTQPWKGSLLHFL